MVLSTQNPKVTHHFHVTNQFSLQIRIGPGEVAPSVCFPTRPGYHSIPELQSWISSYQIALMSNACTLLITLLSNKNILLIWCNYHKNCNSRSLICSNIMIKIFLAQKYVQWINSKSWEDLYTFFTGWYLAKYSFTAMPYSCALSKLQASYICKA